MSDRKQKFVCDETESLGWAGANFKQFGATSAYKWFIKWQELCVQIDKLGSIFTFASQKSIENTLEYNQNIVSIRKKSPR